MHNSLLSILTRLSVHLCCSKQTREEGEQPPQLKANASMIARNRTNSLITEIKQQQQIRQQQRAAQKNAAPLSSSQKEQGQAAQGQRQGKEGQLTAEQQQAEDKKVCVCVFLCCRPVSVRLCVCFHCCAAIP